MEKTEIVSLAARQIAAKAIMTLLSKRIDPAFLSKEFALLIGFLLSSWIKRKE